MRRTFWFGLGVICGAFGAVYLQRRIAEIRERYTPPAVANRMTDAIKRFGSDVAESARAGRSAMAEREHDMRRGRAESPVSV